MSYAQKRICKECGKEFIAKSPRQFYCKDDHYRPCPVCGKSVLVKPNTWNDPPRCCSKECMVKLKEKTCLDKYGTVDPGNSEVAKEKRRQTCLDKYGVDNPSKSKEVKNKIKQTFQDKYGVENAGQLEGHSDLVKEYWNNLTDEELQDINDKKIKTCQERYGVDNPRQNKDIIQKTKDTLLDKYGVDCALHISEVEEKVNATMIERYGVVNALQSEEIRKKIRDTNTLRYGAPYYSQTEEYQTKIQNTCFEKYGVLATGSIPSAIEKRKQTNIDKYGVPAAFLTEESIQKARQSILKNKKSRISKINLEYASRFEALGLHTELEVVYENRWFNIVLPEINIAVEIDPTFTHCSEPTHLNLDGIDKNYHKIKSLIAMRHGLRCIHVYDWDKKDKICMLVTPYNRKHYARNLSINYIESKCADKFFELYHIQGKYEIKKYA